MGAVKTHSSAAGTDWGKTKPTAKIKRKSNRYDELGQTHFCQGNCMKFSKAEQTIEVVLIPASPFSRSLYTDFPRFVLFDEVEGKMAYYTQVGSRMPHADFALILAKGYVEALQCRPFSIPHCPRAA
jgi:hypothetical protein